MEDIKEIKQDIKEIKSSVAQIHVMTAENTANLKQHMVRTELNENRIATIEKWTLGLLTSIVLAILAKLYL